MASSTIEINAWLAVHEFHSYQGEDYLEPIRRMARDFEKAHPDYRVNVEGRDVWTLPQQVAQAAEQGTPPDIAEYYATATQLARDTYLPDGRPLFTSIGAALNGRSEVLGEPVLLDEIEPLARDFFSYQGELASVPATITTTVLYANASVLRDAGVREVPRTWTELVDACEAVARMKGGPAHGVAWPNHGWLFQQALAQQDGLITNNGNGRDARATAVDLASKEMLAWAEWWQRLIEQGHYRYFDDWWSAFEAFTNQEAAFTLSSSKLAEEFVQVGAANGFEVDVRPMPYNQARPYAGNVVSGHSLWLADGLGEAKREGALAFTQYLLNPSNVATWHQAIGYVPVTGAAYDLLAADGWFDRKPHQRAAVEQLRASARTPATAGALLGDFAGIQHAMTRAMRRVLLDGADPAASFARATGEAQLLLDEHNAGCLQPVPRTPDRLEVY